VCHLPSSYVVVLDVEQGTKMVFVGLQPEEFGIEDVGVLKEAPLFQVDDG
jgi:hypothetical protein